MRKIKKGDDVVIISGKDKGKRGSVTKVSNDHRLLVTNINMVKCHKKASAHGGTSGIINQEMFIHASNVALFNSQIGKFGKIGFKILEDGRKVRMFKFTKEVIER